MLEYEVYVITHIIGNVEMFMKNSGVFDEFKFKQTKFFNNEKEAKYYFKQIYGINNNNYKIKKVKLIMSVIDNDKSCEDCINNDSGFSNECYRCCKGIEDNFIRKE